MVNDIRNAIQSAARDFHVGPITNAGQLYDAAGNIIDAAKGAINPPPSIDPRYGNLDDEQKQIYSYAVAAAKKYNIPVDMLTGILWQEGKFRADPGGDGGGTGQFTTQTAAGYGVTQAQLRADPKYAVDLAAKLLSDNAATLGVDPAVQKQMVAVSYFIGAGSVQDAIKTGGTNWLDAADTIAAKYPQNGKIVTAHDYLGLVGLGGSSSTGTANISRNDSSTTSDHPTGPAKRPDYNDYWVKDDTGTWVHDDVSWGAAEDAYLKNRLTEQQLDMGPVASYMDDIIKQIGADISSGQLSLDKANDLATVRINSTKNALDYLSSDAYKYGAPVGSEYVPGRGPDDYNVKVLGLPVLKAQQGTIDPMQQALDINNSAADSINAIKVPNVPSTADIASQARTAIGNGAYGAGATGGASPPPGPPPPDPTPHPPSSPPGGSQQAGYIMPTNTGQTDEELMAIAANLARNRG